MTVGVAMASLVGVGVSITLSCPAITALAMTFGGGGDEDNVHVGMKEGGQLGREKRLFNYTRSMRV